MIEVDGATHSKNEEIARDNLRNAKLRSNGNSILRFTNEEVYSNLDGIVETIWLKLRELHPRMDAFSPQRELQ